MVVSYGTQEKKPKTIFYPHTIHPSCTVHYWVLLANVFLPCNKFCWLVLQQKTLGFFFKCKFNYFCFIFGKIHQIFNITNLKKKKRKNGGKLIVGCLTSESFASKSSFILEWMWMVFKLLGLGLHDKIQLNHAPLTWREVSITWPIELILKCILALSKLNMVCRLKNLTCFNPYMTTSRKASKKGFET